MPVAYTGAQILNPSPENATPWLNDHAVIVVDDQIQAVIPQQALPNYIETRIDLQGLRLIPGFFDTQVNGGGGVLFNDSPNLDGLIAIAEAHAHFGTTALLPTLISDDIDVVKKALEAVEKAIDQHIPGIEGIHLEGPFLNPQRKGVHNASKFRQLDETTLNLLCLPRRGKILLTLAPEQTRPEYIKRLTAAGVTVAAGHTAASYEETRLGLDAGIRSFTHLFNAMTPLASREPGCVGAALEDTNAWCGIIVDGHHVHPTTLKIALRAKPKGKVVLVTDAMPVVGSKNTSFTLNGDTIHVENGRCSTAEGTLAGSDLNMISAVNNCVEMLNVPLPEAARMASLYPAQMMGLQREFGSIQPGKRASFLAIDQQIQIVRRWVNGKEK